MKKYILTFTLFTILSLLYMPVDVQAQTPGETIIATIDRGMQILRDPSLQSEDAMELRRDRLWEELAPIFNFDEISRRSLGRYWLSLNPQQKKVYSELFTTVLKDVYLRKSDNYSDGNIVYIREIVKGNRSKVQTNFVNGDKRIVVNFSMKKSTNVWRIYDVTIEGVSVLTNYRTQFDSILKKSSFEDLMDKLKEREMEISEEY